MNINYRNEHILEAETVNEKEITTIFCDKCGDTWELENSDIILEPWPHFDCPHCGESIPLF